MRIWCAKQLDAAFRYAQEEAAAVGVEEVTPEHLLLGAMYDADSVAARVLKHFAVDKGRVIQEARVINDSVSPGKPLTMRVSKRAKWVIDLTSEEAGAQKKREINTGHLLLGLLREGGTAAQILQNNGVTLEVAREAVKQSVSENTIEDK